jgi:hypothetical protein
MEVAGVAVLLASGRTLTDYETSSDRLLVREIFLAMRGRQRETP